MKKPDFITPDTISILIILRDVFLYQFVDKTLSMEDYLC